MVRFPKLGNEFRTFDRIMYIDQIPQQAFRFVYLVLALYLGIAAGYFCAALVGVGLVPEVIEATAPVEESLRPQAVSDIANFATITERNIFNSKSEPEPEPAVVDAGKAADRPVQQQPRVKLVLHGTVEAGPESLALLSGGGQTEIFRLGDQLPGKAILQQVERNRVLVEYPSGKEEWLVLFDDKAKESPAPERSRGVVSKPKSSTGSGVREVAENRYEIDRQIAEKARQDINQLMRQVRMEPYVQDGKTSGFLVRWIQPNTFLSQLGLRRGDVVDEINQVKLDSPEKALMIFQQLREARSLSIGIRRNGKPQLMRYDIK